MRHTKQTLPYRRKREGKTDYNNRLRLLKSKMPRLIIRKSNKHVVIQVAEFDPKGDRIILSYKTDVLRKKGWEGSLKNIPSSYLLGLFVGKKLLEKGYNKELIVDIGLQRHHKGSRLYAAVKGIVDAGVKVRCSEEIFPSEERIKGEHINKSELFEKIKSQL